MNITSITANITRQYVFLATIALTVGAPVSYFLIKALFDMILSQVRKVVKANPVMV